MTNNLDKGCAKILVLGDSGVGKSSLIHLICHSTVLSSAQWTIGCSIDVKLHDNYFLEFWDIGGSRTHKIARSFLYQDYHGIILVFDATNKKSRSNLNEWLLEVSHKTNDKDLDTFVNINVPTMTIATKRDLVPYGTVLETSENNEIYRNADCSVVNIGDTAPINYPYRRHQSSTSSISPLIPPVRSFSAMIDSNAGSVEALMVNPVIYVNTQDALSFQVASSNYEKLNTFFRQVIDRRNKKFYNKFAI